MNQEIKVKGLTCANCVKHVTGALTQITGVAGVSIDLVANGVSTVHIDGENISQDQITAALSKAGPKYVIA